MDIGFSTGCLKHFTPHDIMGFSVESGIELLEIWDQDGFLAENDYDPHHVRSLLQYAGIKVVSVHTPFEPSLRLAGCEVRRYLESLEASCRKAQVLGAKYVVIHAALVDDENPGAKPCARSIRKSLELWRHQVDIAGASGLMSAFENLPTCKGWPSGCTYVHLAWMVDAIKGPSVGICLDISHCFALGQSPVDAVAFLKDTPILAIHASDGLNGSFADSHLPPGQGDLDWRQFFKVLKAQGFNGTVMIEVKTSNLDSKTARSIAQFLRSAEGGDESGQKGRESGSSEYTMRAIHLRKEMTR